MNYFNLYADFLKKFINPKRRMKVVFDCSNGTTGLVLEKLFAGEQKCETILLNKTPDGNFPAHGPNPLAKGAMDELKKKVAEERADLGVIFDADGDRAMFVDDRGREVAPDPVIILIAREVKGPVALTIDIGPLAREVLAEEKRKIVDSRVGHYFIKKLIREKKIAFAAERSGHYYFKDFFYLDSAIFAALQMMNRVSQLPVSLSGWIDQLPQYFRSGEINFEVQDKKGTMKRIEDFYATPSAKISKLDGLTVQSDDIWFNIRPSNTENLLRLNLEAKNKQVFDKELSKLKALTSGK